MADELATPEASVTLDEPGLLLARLPLDTRARRQPHSVEELPSELLDAIHNHAVLENGVPYINTACASNEMVDSYGTRMRPTSLRNYADDATNGISLQNSHRTDELPLGRTFRGHYRAGKAPNPSRTEMDFFIPPNLNISGVNTSDVIKAIDYGSVRDVSIGFYGGELRCSIDGKPMMGDLLSLLMFGSGDDAETRDPNAPCPHLPGVEYAMRDKDGRKTGDRAVAIGEVEGAHCAELSLVFDGATPMAQIAGRSAPVFAKAYRMAEMEILPKPVALALESRYRGVRFPSITTPRFYVRETNVTTPTLGALQITSVENEGIGDRSQPMDDELIAPELIVQEPGQEETPRGNDKENRAMPDPQLDSNSSPGPTPGAVAVPGGEVVSHANPSTPPSASDPMERAVSGLRSALVTAGLAPEGFAGDLATRFVEIGREMSDLRAWADIGREARERLVDECRKEGVRAFGASGFRESAYGPVLSRGSYAELQDLFAHFRDVGNSRFQGGRATQDEAEPPQKTERRPETVRVPARAYRA